MNKVTIAETSLPSVLFITPPTIFEDFRGSYVEIYNEVLYREAGLNIPFVQDDVSTSRQNVLRGIHGDDHTHKLISCLHGAFYAVVVNCDQGSPLFGKWVATTLSASNRQQILVPPKHGLAHLILSDVALFHYKQSSSYDRSSQFTYRWDDPRFNIYWPVKTPILSQRDSMIGD